MTDRIGASYTSPATSFFLAADHISSDNVNGRWLVRFYLRAQNGPGGSTGSQYNGAGAQVGYYNGNEFGRHSGNPFLPSGFANGATRWNDGPWDIWINGRAAWTMPLSMLAQYGNVNGWSYGSIPLPQLANIPNQPATPTASEVQPTSMRINWSIPGNGGSAIDQMLLRRSVNPDLSTPYFDFPQAASATSALITGLTPATTYYWAVFAHNAVGYSPRSGVLTQATVPSTAPGLSVIPALSGASSSAILTPPGGATGVTKYVLQRRALGTTTPVISTESATSPIATTGLTPGSSWEYRAMAFFGTYETPWTDWITVTQPNPNTDAGTFFDGNTADTSVLDYSWTGTANNSTSIAQGKIPTGWKTFVQSATSSGGTGAVFQALGGVQGAHAARAVFFTDTTATGFVFGTAGGAAALTAMADVEAGGAYFGSIYAWPSRKQRLRAVIRWWTVTGTYISASTGADVVVEPGGYTRLVANDVAPANAQWASIEVQNQAGVDGSLWLGGDWLQLDAAMVSLQALFDYFDGDTPDTQTFRYDWLGTANASASQRSPVTTQGSDPLTDPDCPPIPGAPQPPQIETECIEDVGTWRRYWVVIPESEVYDWLAVVPTLTITTGGFAARQVRIRFYPNPDGVPPTAVVDLPIESEQIISYMPANTVFTLDGVSQSAWASVAGGDERPADHLLYGANGLPATWPVLSCGDAYLISVDVPLDAPEGNIVTGASLTTRMM